MNENQQRRAEIIKALYDRSWQNISERRSYEWRAAYMVWIALAAIIVLAVQNELSVQPISIIGIGIIGLFLCLLHTRWLNGLQKQHSLEVKKAIFYEESLRGLADVTLNKNLAKELEARRQTQESLWTDWSASVQLGVTYTLWIASILILFLIH